MKLSFVSNAYIKHSIEETIEHIARYGYQGIEIARTHGVHELSKVRRKNLLARIKSHGIEVCAIQGGDS